VAMDKLLTLGRSGLRVSPLCLGAMTFGDGSGWTNDERTAHTIIDAFLDAGGNFIDTADVYTQGQSERIVGAAFKQSSRRTRAVIATKYTFGGDPNDPNSVGNGRKNAYRAVEESLQRLGTDYIDLYWLHAWDVATPHQELVQTFDALIRAGKIRYYGLSDVPAWYAVRLIDYAEHHGMASPIALQLEYSLAERVIEREHLPFAALAGLGLCPWSPLAGGMLTGKYIRGEVPASGRMSVLTTFQRSLLDNEQVWKVVDALRNISSEVGASPAEVALHWVFRQYRSTSVIIGATRLDQLESNMRSLELKLNKDHWAQLDLVSRLPSVAPYNFFFPGRLKQMLGCYDGFDPYPY
jgi:aryl-alcohol dehydrogenase-like predicted oxidoreductase